MKGHTIPWLKEKENDDDKQWPTKHYTENWVSRSPLKTRGKMEGTSPCSSSVTLAINLIINHERGKQ